MPRSPARVGAPIAHPLCQEREVKQQGRAYKFLLVVVAAGLCAGPVVTAAALALGTIPVLARAA